jgi:hypothetical protein
MINFCTLFDSGYLTRALAMYESLSAVSPSFHLYVVAFDDNSYRYLEEARLPHVTPISLQAFEDDQLLAVKPTRSPGEYCWTCTSSVILYCIGQFGLPSCTYIDADMIFYHDPQVLLDELGERSILITDHRFTKEYKMLEDRGIYCVQFMYFRNDKDGMTALRWWRERCLEWCYARLENGKFGDQKYLDDWTRRFHGVAVLKHPGGGMAPWNVQQFNFYEAGKKIFLRDRQDGSYPLVFFHFQGVRFYSNGMASLSGTVYEIGPDAKRLIYFPYLKKIMEISSRLRQHGVPFNENGAKTAAPAKRKLFLGFVKELWLLIRSGNFSPFRLKNYNFSRHYHYYHLDQLNDN